MPRADPAADPDVVPVPPARPAPRRFQLQRDTDLTGISGVGAVADGVQFADGTCALRWATGTASTGVYASAADVVTIHGHGGATRLVWIDEDPTPATAGLLPAPPEEDE